ncbi:allophanate hydrolase subunit 1 [Actibacterium atlanticum]|uniref:Allophanate hydrolase subunit 1 n=1 Tax=Actibacterium atlanticum TaxID=1461693 RepID=A0A058ZKP9_9RHOB|nr:carboxyltransferase domain-containing protein [Actibacterium atlanticum]KCV81747.1 allophanate hydrolase subunit 1 [Actibacterium atlanticum]
MDLFQPSPSAHPGPELPELLPLGPDGIVVRFGRVVSPQLSAAVLAFEQAVQENLPDGVTEVAPSLSSVLVRFDPARGRRDQVLTALRKLLGGVDWLAETLPPASRIWHVPVCFGADQAPDLKTFCQLAGLSSEQAIAQITQTPLRVLAIGFAPGQPYLGYLPPAWDIPRRAALTPQVPAGALVAALRQLVLFNHASPTGWFQIGETAFRPFQRDRTVPFALKSGDSVQFHAIGSAEYSALKNRSDGLGGARYEAGA